MKKKIKIVIILLLFTVFLSCFLEQKSVVFASDNSDEVLETNVIEQLDNIDFYDFEKALDGLSSMQKTLFEDKSFLEKVKALLSGEIAIDFSSFFGTIWSIICQKIIKLLPLLCTIIGIAILFSIISQTSSSKNKSVQDIIYYVCFSVLVVLIFGAVTEVVKMTNETLLSLKSQMEISFPILLTLMASIGSTVSVGVYQPVVAILSGSIMTIFTNFIMPLFIFCLVFTVVGNLSNNIKLNNFSKLFQNIFKWTIGIVFTLFSSFLAIQGITAGSYDGVSIRTTKYAMKSYIAFVGSYLSDGLNIILTSSILIKNTVGMAGLLLLISTIISPIINVLLLKLVLSLSASVIEPICDKKICDFLTNVSKCLSMLVATICVAGFAYILTIGLIMCTGNII